MKTLVLALGLVSLVPLAAQAQIVLQPPVVIAPAPGPYWRNHADDDWRRRAEFREEQRHVEWRREHCVRDYRGQEFCRR